MRPSPRPALLASEILPQNLNLRDGERRTVKCPDCEAWRPLKRSMISPHRVDDDPAPGPRRYKGDNTPRPRAGRCPGSAQLITMDITVEQWGRALLDAESLAASRRSARQFYKPLATAPVPVSRMARAPKSQSQAQYFQNELNTAHQRAHEAVALHRSSCAACQAGRFCGTGRQLEERRTWTEETREEQRTKQAREQKADRGWERRRDEDQARRRQAQWAERGGKTVETANNRCARRAPGARSDFRGPQVPMAPQDVEAHDRRQAELGKQYTRRAATA